MFIYTIHGVRDLMVLYDKYWLMYTRHRLMFVRQLINYARETIDIFFPNLLNNITLQKRIKNRNALFSVTENQIILTVSLHSKYAINYFFPQLELSKILVFYSPHKFVADTKYDEVSVLNKFSLKQNKYILLICGDRVEKGAYRACIALQQLFLAHGNSLNNIRVIVLGVSNTRHYRHITNNSEKFIFTDYVEAGVLEILYKNAFLFMYPTLDEGFGYPPLEAMKYGTLCACSANSSVTEVCGDAVLYFNPYDITEIGIRVLQSFDENIRTEKIKKMEDRFSCICDRQEKDVDGIADVILTANLQMT
jgi:hypothetical protein